MSAVSKNEVIRVSVNLSQDYGQAANALQIALQAKSATEVVQRALALLKYAHEESLKIIRVSSKDQNSSAIEINHPDYYPKAVRNERLRVHLSEEDIETINYLIGKGVGKNRAAVIRSALGYMAQFYHALEQHDNLFKEEVSKTGERILLKTKCIAFKISFEEAGSPGSLPVKRPPVKRDPTRRLPILLDPSESSENKPVRRHDPIWALDF